MTFSVGTAAGAFKVTASKVPFEEVASDLLEPRLTRATHGQPLRLRPRVNLKALLCEARYAGPADVRRCGRAHRRFKKCQKRRVFHILVALIAHR
jgi:hypothetical protein